MSEKHNVFKDILETSIQNSMEGTRFSNLSEQDQSQLAVVAALELIKADVSASSAIATTIAIKPSNLHTHMENLSIYRDLILKAMNEPHQGE